MNVLVVEPGYAPYEKEINGLDEMQATVGGLITTSYPYKEQVAIVSNDESILLGMDYNRSIPGGYSFGNALLILFQCPTATRVAGYTTWKKDFGRNVKRHEKGIQILAPCPTQRYVWQEVTDPNTGKVLCNPDGSPRKETQLVTITRFKVATVFDISQTEGKELPTLGVARLTGDVENFTAIYDKLTSLSPVTVEIDTCPGEANGYFSSAESRIVLRPGMSQIQTVKTLIHEIAHAKAEQKYHIPQ